MGNSDELSKEQEKTNNYGDKSILDRILDSFISILSKDSNFSAEMAQSLRDIISRGQYSDKETVANLFKKTNKDP
jgi:hypothetical protein